jgi:hypothetical protein
MMWSRAVGPALRPALRGSKRPCTIPSSMLIVFHRGRGTSSDTLPRRSTGGPAGPASVPRGFESWPFSYAAKVELDVVGLDTATGAGVGWVTLDCEVLATRPPPPPPAKPPRGRRQKKKRQMADELVPTMPSLANSPPSPESWAVQIPGALPGERVIANVHRTYSARGYSEAALVDVVGASAPERVVSTSNFFPDCCSVCKF